MSIWSDQALPSERPTRRLGSPHVHLRSVGSTNSFARDLATGDAPDGTLVSATEQPAGRGRQGRDWTALPGGSLLCSWVVREPPALLSLAAGVAVAQTADLARERYSLAAPDAHAPALIKWPNDVLIAGRKVAGILVEGRPQEDWAVLGIGLNVALRQDDLPPELRDRAGTLGLNPADLNPVLALLGAALEYWLSAPAAEARAALGDRDALAGQPVSWTGGTGIAAGIDDHGRLVVTLAGGGEVRLDAGEVHLQPAVSDGR